jgi:hypothetical protein
VTDVSAVNCLEVALATVHFKHLGQDAFTPNLFLTQESYALWQSIETHPKRLNIAGALVPASLNLIHPMNVWDLFY